MDVYMCVGQEGDQLILIHDRSYLPPLGLGLGDKKYFRAGRSPFLKERGMARMIAKLMNSGDLNPNMLPHLPPFRSQSLEE